MNPSRRLIRVTSPDGKDAAQPHYGVVSGIDGETVSVIVDGQTQATPCATTVKCSVGARVIVEVYNHKAVVVGNVSSPATDDELAQAADTKAKAADEKATTAMGQFATLSAQYAQIDELVAEKADIRDLTAERARVDNLMATKASVEQLEAEQARIQSLEATSLTAQSAVITDLQAQAAYIDDLKAKNITAEDIAADHAAIDNLDSNYAHITNGEIDNATIGHAKVTGLSAQVASIADARISQATIEQAQVRNLSAEYAKADLANVTNAYIDRGVFNTAAIVDEQVFTVTGNKATLAELDASKVNVTNLQAKSIQVEKINGVPVTGKSVADALAAAESEIDGVASDVSALDSKLDSAVDTLNGRIDAQIETFTAKAVPTLSNYPASDWSTDKLRAEHVGDICYVVNAGSSADGYTYRFARDESGAYSWVLIKDNQVTAALQRLLDAEGNISGLQSFETEISSWKTDTDAELSSLKSSNTTLTTTVGKTLVATTQLWFTKANTTAPNKPTAQVTVSDASKANQWNLAVPTYSATYPNYFYCWQYELADGTFTWSDVVCDSATTENERNAHDALTQLTTKVETSTFNEVKQTVDENSATITQLTTKVEGKADGSTVTTLTNTVNEVKQTATSNSSKISSLETVNSKNGLTESTNITQRTSAIEQDLSGFKSTVSSTYATQASLTAEANQRKAAYVTSSTAAGTAAKVGTCANFALYTGARIACTFTTANTAATPTLNVNSTGAKQIRSYTGAALTEAEYKWAAGATFDLVYDGSYWRMQDAGVVKRVTQAETSIIQNSEAIALRATKAEAYQVAQPNLSPFFESTPYRTATTYDGGYWAKTNDDWLMSGITALTDGWAHLSVAASKRVEIAIPRIESIDSSKKYTLLFEWRNVTVTGSPNLYTRNYPNNCQFTKNSYSCGWTTSSAKSGTKYVVMGVDTTAKSTNWAACINLGMTNGSGVSFEGDLRLSLYEGEYTGPYKPYSGSQLYASQAELKVTNDSISTKVEKAGVISSINQSAESVKIQASKVEIDGTAIFTNSGFQTALKNTMDGFDILWNRAEFASDTNAGGECYLCAYDPVTGTRSDANGWVMWNGTKRTVTKGMFKPNAVLPYNIPIYIVCRLSSATATTGTNYMVWYDGSWKGGPMSPAASTIVAWTWAEATDIVLGKFVEPGSEVAFTECETYRPPRKWGTITNQTTINGGRITTNSIEADKLKVTDLQAIGATIGGFQIDSSSVHTKGVAVTSNADNSIALSSADFTRTLNSVSRAGLRMAIGDKFGVTGDGVLYAHKAVLSGLTVGAFDSSGQASILNSNVSVGGRNLATDTSNAKSLTQTSTNSHFTPIGFYPTSDHGLSLLKDTSNLSFVVSFDWAATGVTTAFQMWASLKNTATSYMSVSADRISVPTGASSGHFSAVFTPLDTHRSYGEKWLLSRSTTTANTSGTITITNFMFERGNKPTDWSPAPEDMATQAGVDGLSSDMNEAINNVSSAAADAAKAAGTAQDTADAAKTAADGAAKAIKTYTDAASQWLTFNGTTGLTIGATGSKNNVTVTNDRLSFNTASGEAAYASGGEFHAPKFVADQTLQIGTFAWVNNSGDVGLKYVG